MPPRVVLGVVAVGKAQCPPEAVLPAMPTLDTVALECLSVRQPDDKLASTVRALAAWRDGKVEPLHSSAPVLPAEEVAGRPQRPRLVPPRELPRRRLGSVEGRAALLHAVAHIEFNAINLAWDAVYRFRDMPRAYYANWIGIAADEARHFALVRARLAELGCEYGDFDAHNGLWDMACNTADSCLARMALVPRVLGGRGAAVTAGLHGGVRRVGDAASVQVLEVILEEEVPHVAAGSRWFEWCCVRAGVEPEATFRSLLAERMAAPLKPPFNRPARLAAGFSNAELDRLEQIT